MGLASVAGCDLLGCVLCDYRLLFAFVSVVVFVSCETESVKLLMLNCFQFLKPVNYIVYHSSNFKLRLRTNKKKINKLFFYFSQILHCK